jgi:large subunit ribosomal protein L47
MRVLGRQWTYQELSVKDWDDLHKLYWTCVLEVNRTATRAREMQRVKAGYGSNEAGERMDCVSIPSYNTLHMPNP